MKNAPVFLAATCALMALLHAGGAEPQKKQPSARQEQGATKKPLEQGPLGRILVEDVCAPDLDKVIDDLTNLRTNPVMSSNPAIRQIITGSAIDAAREVVEHSKMSKSDYFTAAYRGKSEAIERLAAKTYTNEVTYSEEWALRALRGAMAVDLARAFARAYQEAKPNNFREAYAKYKEDLETLAAKNWELDEITSTSREIFRLRDVTWAHFRDVATELRNRSSQGGTLSDAYRENKKILDAIADDPMEERTGYKKFAVCRVLKAVKEPNSR
ncbi:MAG: hypothetical protein ACRD4U_06115 [Candidatus Acidiferrales bacterium]